MEASEILNMVEDALYSCFFIIYVIVSNDNITIQAVLKHTSKGDQGQVLKLSKLKIDEEIPEPSFLADPSHQVKVVAKQIFSIVKKIRAQLCGCTNADALQIKKEWGYTIKDNRKKIEELIEASKVPLEHMLNNHEKFST